MNKQVFEFHAACRDIVICRSNPALNYAVGYAQAGLAMNNPWEIQVQCLYILNNISKWRGPIATAARNIFKQLAKANSWKKTV